MLDALAIWVYDLRVMNTRQLILYACPVGELANQLEHYFQASRQHCGENSAHRYMPHCTLTGFFQDAEQAIALYTSELEQTLAETKRDRPIPVAHISQLLFEPNWHGLSLDSPWLQQFTQTFASRAESPTRSESLRLKTWLHVSLAYNFDPSHVSMLKQLALDHVDPTAQVDWELRFYERSPSNQWTCHHAWRL